MTLASSAVGHGAGIENGTDYLGTRSPRLVTKQSAGGKTPLHDLLQLDQGSNSARSSHLGSAGHSSCGARLLTVLPRKTTVVIEVNRTFSSFRFPELSQLI